MILQKLPRFRKDLKIHLGPSDHDGSPTYNLFDPIKGQYYKLTWKESLIFRLYKPDMTLQELADTIHKFTTLNVDNQDIEYFFIQAEMLGLTTTQKGSNYYQNKSKAQEQNIWQWLLYHYLYIRIPLFSPDKFLTRTLHYVRPFVSFWAFAIYTLIALVGVYFVIQNFQEFLHTFTYFFNLQGFVSYALAITCVKVIHELSHAYTAKNYGLYVPTMGIAFIVLWPVLYTDVTDGWKLSKRSERLMISFAGVAAELVIAGLATMGWVLSSPGIIQSVFFILASTSLFSTLVINLNPAVRFDGYYMFCDLIGVDNLQTRAYLVTRWKYLDVLFGVKTECPEDLPPTYLNGMVAYTLYSWVYRIVLYTGIAVFVYYEFTKALGIFLFGAEVIIFMLWPIYYEAKQVYMVRKQLTLNKRLLTTLSLVTAFLIWFIVPWPHYEKFYGAIRPIQDQIVYVPVESVVRQLYVRRGDNVTSGQPLIETRSKPLLTKMGSALLDIDELQKEIVSLSQETKNVNYLAVKQSQLGKAKEYYEQLQQQDNQLLIKANFPGKVYEWDPDIKVGQALSQGTIIGRVVGPEGLYAIAYVPESHLNDFKVGQKAKVISPEPLLIIMGTVVIISSNRVTNLEDYALASFNRGPLPVVADEKEQNIMLIESYYAVYIKIEGNNENLKFGQEVEIEIQGPWRSQLMTLVNYVRGILLRESSL
jgi:putative peptide zinc metalloprotease protein